MAKGGNAQQQTLFVDTQTGYAWKSIKELQRGEAIVITDQEVRIQGIKMDEDFWSVLYTDPLNGKKIEQLYNATDFVYTRI
ncbi:hypothetical protein ccbrp13_09300 [Ktedonobacteria bacterium brp13]|nr:hypothetical protein ccbrp13_09300 [Ktedonobacteria bacterium brp13]